MGQKPGALQFKTEAFAQRGAGKTVNGTRGIFAIQYECIGQKTLDGARIDIGLVRYIAAIAQPAPIANQQMRILVLHEPCSPFWQAALPRNGTPFGHLPGNTAKPVPVRLDLKIGAYGFAQCGT